MATKKMAVLPVKQEFCINDPFGNFIVLDRVVTDLQGQPVKNPDVFEKALLIISRPLLVLEMEGAELDCFYIGRDGDTMIAAGVKLDQEQFLLQRIELNPSPQVLSVLYKKAKRIR